MEHRAVGATTQEVYSRATNVFNHQTNSKELVAWPEPEDEDKCLDKGPNREVYIHTYKTYVLLAKNM